MRPCPRSHIPRTQTRRQQYPRTHGSLRPLFVERGDPAGFARGPGSGSSSRCDCRWGHPRGYRTADQWFACHRGEIRRSGEGMSGDDGRPRPCSPTRARRSKACGRGLFRGRHGGECRERLPGARICWGELMRIAIVGCGDIAITQREYLIEFLQRAGLTALTVCLPLTVMSWTTSLLEEYARLRKTKPLLSGYRLTAATRDIRFDISKAKAELGWKPNVPLQEGLQRTFDWYRGRLTYTPG